MDTAAASQKGNMAKPLAGARLHPAILLAQTAAKGKVNPVLPFVTTQMIHSTQYTRIKASANINIDSCTPIPSASCPNHK